MKNRALLVLNAGSATLKYALFADDLAPLSRGNLAHDGSSTGIAACLATALAAAQDHEIAAIGHRVVHGGSEFAAPCRITDTTLAALTALIPLAPLHQPHNLAGIHATRAALPGVPQIACFDTAFHRSQPELMQHYGLPRKFFDAGIRRYGFHGLSYESIVAQLPAQLGTLATGKVIIAHLGNGASLCAVEGGRSVATSMGFSTLDGLLMGTRCGSLDPGVILHLMAQHGLDHSAVEQLLYRQSGLLGLSGISADMRTLLASSEPAATEAVDYFCEQVVRAAGGLAAAMRGADALIFTGGIGEHAAAVRERISTRLAWLGVQRTLVIPCDEEGTIARHTRMAIP